MTDPEEQESDGGIWDYPEEPIPAKKEPEFWNDDDEYEAALEKEWERYDH